MGNEKFIKTITSWLGQQAERVPYLPPTASSGSPTFPQEPVPGAGPQAPGSTKFHRGAQYQAVLTARASSLSLSCHLKRKPPYFVTFLFHLTSLSSSHVPFLSYLLYTFNFLSSWAFLVNSRFISPYPFLFSSQLAPSKLFSSNGKLLFYFGLVQFLVVRVL